MRSEWVRYELERALLEKMEQSGKHIFPLLVDGSKAPRSLSGYVHIDFSKGFEQGLAKLLLRLKNY
jgi:hypothetical protein